MKSFIQKSILTPLLLMSFAASAAPILQLDIGGGSYVQDLNGVGEESIMTTADIFTVYAYANPGSNPSDTKVSEFLDDTYYLSIALTPKITQTNPAPDYGSIEFLGNTINVAGDMTFGNPPVADGSNPQLGPHSIFDTYYYEYAFSMKDTQPLGQKSQIYNTELNSGSGPITPTSATDPFMFYEAFAFDISNLSQDVELHFDLYTLKDNGAIDKSAPFSHDAGTRPGTSTVPEPSSLGLMLLGLITIGLAGRRRRLHG